MPCHDPGSKASTTATQLLETDYLVIGAGAAGMAFTDTLIDHGNAQVTLLDSRARPGGHWNDAYGFVTLHQPSAFYGVNSTEPGHRRKDVAGPNAGLYELATGAEINGYYDRVLHHRLLPSGRVQWRPMTRHLGHEGGVSTVESLLTGERWQIVVRRNLVDANYMGPPIPATHVPRFAVAPGVRLLPPGGLLQLWQPAQQQSPPRRFVVLGAGKTAMDAVLWLLATGVPAAAIQWVVPRDSWLIDRVTTQPAPEFFDEVIGGQADQMQAIAEARSVPDLFLRLEACGALMRIDPERTPTMFHLATVSRGECALLRSIGNVVRLGGVMALEPGRMVLEHGAVAVDEDAVFVDCTASAVEPRPTQPVFQPGRIVLQMVRLPQPSFSAALIAYVEARDVDDKARNALCASMPLPNRLEDYPRSLMVNMWNQFQWGQDKELRQWIRESRLDGFGRLMVVPKDDADKQAVLARYKAQAAAAMANLPRLMAA